MKPADDKLACRINEILGGLREEMLGKGLLDDFLDAEFLDRRVFHLGGVLC